MGATFKVIEVCGTSSRGVTEAIESAIATAASSLRNLAWFEVGEVRGRIQDQKVAEYQVVMKIGFKLEGGA